MDVVRITGGKKLQGKVCVQGSKNAALPMMAAALLHKGVSVLRQCPKLTDIFYMEEILRSLGAVTWWEKEDLYLDCTFADKTEIPVYLSQKMRSSIILMGAILSRHKKVMVGYPGGCVIGARPVDLHLDVLRQLGVIVKESDTEIAGECSDIVCTEIRFARKSVGATEQGILAAVSANGKIIFHNCALEPEIIHLCTFLNSMGAKIQGQGTETISVTGTDGFNGGDMRVPSDRIVAGTYFCAAAITRSEIQMENVPMEEMEAFLEVYRKIGGQYKGKSGTLIVNGRDVCSTAEIKTETYPGFPTDLQSPIMAVLTTIVAFISGDALAEQMELTMQQMAPMMDSNSMALVDSYMENLPQITFFSNLLYCFVFGTVLSYILSRSIPSRDPFADYKPDQQ